MLCGVLYGILLGLCVLLSCCKLCEDMQFALSAICACSLLCSLTSRPFAGDGKYMECCIYTLSV